VLAPGAWAILRVGMGEVVKLQKRARKTKAGGSKPRRRRPRRSKTALVLGGGGFTGGVYEIGALRALDLLAVNRTVNQFDVYVGTSAGSFVASLTANGVTPEEMMRVVNQQMPSPFKDVDRGTLMRPNALEFAQSAALLPLRMLGLARTFVTQARSTSLIDLAAGIAEALPSGLYDGSGIQGYLDDVLSDSDRTRDFRLLQSELFLTATDLDTCERIVFGGPDWDDVPIPQAVAASTALPMVYKPVEIKGRHLVDGGLRSTTNVDVAVEAGAKLVVVVNPLVPYVNDFQKVIPTMWGSRVRRVRDMGFPQIGYQAFKLLAHQRLHDALEGWQERYPGVDIILIEPDPNDELMFETNILNFNRRVEIARHGFESVTLKLASDYDEIKATCAKHGIEISANRVRKVVRKFAEEREQSAGWRRILEQTTGALLRQTGQA
jgi:NTE family protein